MQNVRLENMRQRKRVLRTRLVMDEFDALAKNMYDDLSLNRTIVPSIRDLEVASDILRTRDKAHPNRRGRRNVKSDLLREALMRQRMKFIQAASRQRSLQSSTAQTPLTRAPSSSSQKVTAVRARTVSQGFLSRSPKTQPSSDLTRVSEVREKQRLDRLETYLEASAKKILDEKKRRGNKADDYSALPKVRATLWPYADGRAQWQTILPREQIFQTSPFTLRTISKVDPDRKEDLASPGPFDTVFDLTEPLTQEYVKRLRDWSKQLSHKSRDLIKWWSHGGDTIIQKIARSEGTMSDAQLKTALENDDAVKDEEKTMSWTAKYFVQRGQFNEMEALFHQTLLTAPVTPFPTILWRGIKLDWAKADTLAASTSPFVTRSPQSWTRSPYVAATFLDSNVLLGLIVSEGTRLADRSIQEPAFRGNAMEIATDVPLSIGRHAFDEWEVIIPRGSRMRVLSAYAPVSPPTIRWTRILPSPFDMDRDTVGYIPLDSTRHDPEKTPRVIDASPEVYSPIIIMELLRPESFRQVKTHRVRKPVARPSATDYSRPDLPIGPRASSTRA